jgi:hypothetical protein
MCDVTVFDLAHFLGIGQRSARGRRLLHSHKARSVSRLSSAAFGEARGRKGNGFVYLEKARQYEVLVSVLSRIKKFPCKLESLVLGLEVR